MPPSPTLSSLQGKVLKLQKKKKKLGVIVGDPKRVSSAERFTGK